MDFSGWVQDLDKKKKKGWGDGEKNSLERKSGGVTISLPKQSRRHRQAPSVLDGVQLAVRVPFSYAFLLIVCV